MCDAGSCFKTHQDAPKTLLGRSKDPSGRPRTPNGFGLGRNLVITGSILGPKTPPRRPKSRPRAPQDAPGPLKWSQVGANIELRWVLMLKTVTTPKVPGHQNCVIFSFFSCAMLEAALKRTKTLPRGSWDARRTLQDAPGPVKWSQVGANIELRWVLMMKTVTSPNLFKNTYNSMDLSSSGALKLSQFFIFFFRVQCWKLL